MTITVKALFDAAFAGPRDPRSEAYKAGVLAALRYRIDGAPMASLYPPGSAESDAWYAGTAEGHSLWRNHQSDAAKAATQVFDHDELAVLAYVHVAMPQGFAKAKLHVNGCPDFDVTPKEATTAYNRLRQLGYVAKVGAYIQLTAIGIEYFADLEETISGGCHVA